MNEHRIITLWPDKTAPYTEYSPAQAQPSITEYAVPGAKSAMVVCPGGGYACKVDHEKEPIARVFTDSGIAAYVLDYRVFPCFYEAPLSDALRAIRTVRSLGYEKVGIIGFSAGGHLCLSAATLFTGPNPDSDDPIERISARPDAFVSVYPVASMVQWQHEGSCVNLLGDYKYSPALRRRFSAELNVTENTPPGCLFHSCGDRDVPAQNSLNLALALAAHGVPYTLHVFQNGYHGAGVVGNDTNAEKWKEISVNWLKEQNF